MVRRGKGPTHDQESSEPHSAMFHASLPVSTSAESMKNGLQLGAISEHTLEWGSTRPDPVNMRTGDSDHEVGVAENATQRGIEQRWT
jgi:hypothetical protein